MAKIIIGKDKGKEVKIKKWLGEEVKCSDRRIRSLTNLTFTDSEIEEFLIFDSKGKYFNEFKLLASRRFVRRSEE